MVKYNITSRFNDSEAFRGGKLHRGMDFAMPKGTELDAIQDGIITNVVNDPAGLGKAVYVQMADGKTAIYGHMSDIAVRIGDKVKEGALLGHSGNTGHVVGTNGGYHLHLAIKDHGQFIDPAPYAPLVQTMGDVKEAAHTALSYSDMFNNAMQGFSDALSEMAVNCISLLPSIPTMLQALHSILFWLS